MSNGSTNNPGQPTLPNPPLVHPLRTDLPTLDIRLTVLRFRDAINGALHEGSLTEHSIRMLPSLSECRLLAGEYQRRRGAGEPGTIHVRAPGANLQFTVAGVAPEIYQPVGIAFARVDGTSPAAVFLKFADPSSPFSVVGASPGVTMIEDAFEAGGAHTTTTYKFSLFIQRKSDGAIGIIDPYIENEN